MTRIKVLLTNRTATLFPPVDSDTLERLRKFWSFSPKGLWYMPRYTPTKIVKGQLSEAQKMLAKIEHSPFQNKRRAAFYKETIAQLEKKLASLWDGRISFLRGLQLSAGLFRATWKEAQIDCDVRFVVEMRRWSMTIEAGLPPAADQYRHQNECADVMTRAIPRGGGIVLSATSSGKTAIAARLFSRVTGNCLFVVDQLDLLRQQQAEMGSWLQTELIGFVGESVFAPRRVTVATIQTLNAHRNSPEFKSWYSRIDVMIVDELHEQMGKRNFNVLEAIGPVAVFGLTATLEMKLKETRIKAFAFAGPVIYRFPISEGVKRKVLTEGSVLQLLFSPVKMRMGTKPAVELAMQVTENQLKLDACLAVTRELLLQDRHVTVLVDRVAHLRDVSSILGGIPHRCAFGAVDVDQRQEAKLLFEQESIRLLVANKVFKKGVSIKRIDAMIDMAEMKSKNDAVQKYGRGLRLHKDKTEFIYVDFGTDGEGRFAKAAASRRRALRQSGIAVQVVRNIGSEADAVSAVRRFIRKVTRNARSACGIETPKCD